MKRKKADYIAWLVLLTFVLTLPAYAHFQLIYTPKAALTFEDKGGIPLKLVFTHPFEAGHTMNMGGGTKAPSVKPKAFGVMTKKGKTDLLNTLKAMEFSTPTGKGTGYETTYRLRGMGDFVFYCNPGPYLEEAEDAYIQQITKVVVNRGGVPTCWNEPVGLPVEIMPLNHPAMMWAGNVFRGVVTRNGKPAPNCEIEVEYLNHDIDIAGNKMLKAAKVEAPQDGFVTQLIMTNDRGEFSYAVPRAGWWGFAALGAGGDLKHNGKELSLDAVIWVHAQDMK